MNRKRKRKLRVCIVGPSLDILGGQAVYAQRLLARLAENDGLEMSFLPVNPRLPAPLNLLQRITYVRTVVNSIFYVLSLLWKVPRTDVIHAFSASYWSFLLAPVPAMLVGKLFGKRVILNYLSGEAEDHLKNWVGAVPLMHLAHTIVAQSNYIVDVFARHNLKAEVVPNFIEVEDFPYRKREKLRPHFLSNRNFQEHYNVNCILRAFARIQKNIPEAELIVAGDGPLRERLHAEAHEIGIINVTFTGAVPPEDMAALYDKADIYLNAPDIDNMPNSILEASACGLPVITSDAGGIPYVVTHEETAMMVSCNNDEAIAATAFRLLNQPGLAGYIAANARAEVLKRYTWTAVEDNLVQIYGLK